MCEFCGSGPDCVVCGRADGPLEPVGPAGSWIVSRKNGEVIGEFYRAADVRRFSSLTCYVETAGDYLRRINAEISEGSVSRVPA